MHQIDITELVQTQINYHSSRFRNSPSFRCNQQQQEVSIALECSGGIYSFIVNPSKEISYNGSLYLDPEFRKVGMGRAFVETREAICRDLEINLILININDNPEFWKHLDYNDLTSLDSKTHEQKIKRLDIIFRDPVFKNI